MPKQDLIKCYPQFPDIREKGKTNVEKIHLVLLRMLKIFDTICRKHDIDYWLDYGSLLGAIRYNNFIPWDSDIDIGMLSPDYYVFLEKGVQELPVDIFFQTAQTDAFYQRESIVVPAKLRDKYSSGCPVYHPRSHNGINIDFYVYTMDPIYEKSLSNSYEQYLNNSKTHIKIEEVEYLDECLLADTKFPIPVGFNAYLTRCYGEYMKLPSVKEYTYRKKFLENIDATKPCDHQESLIWNNYTGTQLQL